MENGLSLTKVAKEIGISKSISEKFKKHGYNLINGKLIESRNITNKDISSEKKSSLKSPKKDSERIIDSAPLTEPIQKKGRPKRSDKFKKHTITMNDNLWKKLQIYSIQNETNVSEILQNLVIDFFSR